MTDASGSKFVYVGIDVAKAKFDFVINGGKARTYVYDAKGIALLLSHLKEYEQGSVIALMEATGGLERELALALCLAGYSTVVANPRQAANYAKSMGNLEKSDAIDAAALCSFAKALHDNGKIATMWYQMPTAEQAILAATVTRRAQMVAMRVAENQRMSMKIHPLQAKSIKAVIRTLDREIEKLDKQIARDLDDHFKPKTKLLKEVKGIGVGMLATLMAYLPELGTLNGREIAKLVGVAPLVRDSGALRGRRATYGGRDVVRSALYMSTLTAVRCEPRFREHYQRLITAGKLPKVALVACMNKLLRIMNAIVKSGKPWDQNYHLIPKNA
jgi:transposase